MRCAKTALCTGNGIHQTAGYRLPPFERLTVGQNMIVRLIPSASDSLVVEGDEQIMEYFTYFIDDGRLVLQTDRSCVLRDEKRALRISVYAKNLTEIRHDGEWKIYSTDTLRWPSLTLISENSSVPSSPAAGDFQLTVHNQSLSVIANNLSLFYIEGTTTYLYVGFYGGLSRFEGRHLRARYVEFVHKSANDMEFFPLVKLEGKIYSTGNVLIFNRPDTISVESYYKGKLIRKY